MATPTIVSVTPISGSTGVPTNVSISILFNQEIDTFRLKNGGIFLEGPDESKSLGPGFLEMNTTEDEDEFLSSPGLKGIKEVSFEFLRVDGSGVSQNYYDYGDGVDAGAVYRTKVILTPKRPLGALTEYTVYIVGDEDTSDAYDYGLTTRTVYDVRKGANLGNGDALFYGGYTGSTRQQFFVEITSGGTSGTATYEWWTTTDAIHKVGTTSLAYRLLGSGVKVKFPQGLVYEVGDDFSVWCDVPVYMDGASKYSFTTSSYEAAVIPAASTLVTGSTPATVSSSVSSLSILSISPADRASQVDIAETEISVVFSSSINGSTITDSSVTLTGHAADGDLSGAIPYTETLTKSLSVSDQTLSVVLGTGQLFVNNLVVIGLDSSIADTDGVTLGSNQEFFYGTTLTPFYAGVRSVQLRLGAIGNSFPEETIAMAVWEASREALAFTPLVIENVTIFNHARRNFVACYASLLLINSSGSITGSVRKRLGDFDVSRSEGSGSAGLDDKLQDCIDRFFPLLEAGGEPGLSSVPLQGVVKGDLSVDEPLFGRGWTVPSTPIANDKILYAGHRRWLKSNFRR